MRRLLGILARLGVVAGLGYVVWKVVAPRPPARGDGWEAQPFPFPPAPRAADGAPAASGPAPDGPTVHVPDAVLPGGGPETEVAAEESPWMEPVGGTCPLSHPVKANLRSGIFHVPGGASYDRTRPDRCYADTHAAEADGLRPAKA